MEEEVKSGDIPEEEKPEETPGEVSGEQPGEEEVKTPEEGKEGEETPGEEGELAKDKPGEEKPESFKPKISKTQKAINRKHREKMEALERADALEEENRRLKGETQEDKTPIHSGFNEPEPKRDNFDSDEDFTKALVNWSTDKNKEGLLIARRLRSRRALTLTQRPRVKQ
jgi:hypothetical protein